MKVITSIRKMKDVIRELRAEKKTIGFVPTMGYLHEAHLSLVRESRKKADSTIVSIFVNPLQFGPKEDFKQYPRDIESDEALLDKEGVDYLFYPEVKEMYPEGYKTYVEVNGLQDKLCGQSRPRHFRGVCTVVLKLFHIVEPDLSFFGQKDIQQAVILQRMVRDLNLDVKIEVLPTIREKDGLALSSRNKYLNPEERKAALVLFKSLKEAEKLVERGERKSEWIIEKMRNIIDKEPLAKIDYVEIVDRNELNPLKEISEGALIVLAVFIGKTRLIDNLLIKSKR